MARQRPYGYRPQMSARPIRLTILNDYAVVVAGVAAMLEPYRDRVEVVELVSGLPASADVDLVLYDTFGATQGAALDLRASLVEGSSARLVIFSWNLDSELVAESLRHGAAGYLSKAMRVEQLVGALEAIHEGRPVVPQGTGTVSPPIENDWPGKAQGLTMRESEIVALITQGLTNADIASRSYLSINSVKTYIRTAYRKMGVQRRAQAVLWGVAHGFQPDQVRRWVGAQNR